ncbi:MAG: tyrosine-type recombinase/integrase [Planctomycetaceae bacterium]
MPKFPKPWFRPARGLWYVTLDGRQLNLGPDEDAAFEQYHSLMSAHRAGQLVLVRPETLVGVLDAFLDWTKRHRAIRTYEWYQDRLQWFLGTLKRPLLAAELRPYHIQNWIDQKDCSDGHKRGCVTAGMRAINWARKMGYVDVNPIEGMEKPSAGRREFVITENLFQQVMQLANDEPFRDLLTIAWETGARPQEILAAEARHVDLENKRWIFPRLESKGKKRERVVYLPQRSAEITFRLAAKWTSGRIFRNRKDRPWDRNNINCRFVRMKKHIDVKLCLYNFRHSFATRMIESGVDAVVVAALMGHSDLSMLGRTYAHLSQNAEHLRAQLNRGQGGDASES